MSASSPSLVDDFLSRVSPTLSCIVVSYNTREMTLDCLQCLHDCIEGLTNEVFLVDNASSDETAATVAEHFPNVVILKNDANRGFGAANNQAMKEARGEYFLLLNSDAFPKEGAIVSLLEGINRRPDIGAIGPRLLNADLSLQPSCWRFPNPLRAWLENLGLTYIFRSHPAIGDFYQWHHDSERSVDFVVGACLLIKRKVYDQIGGFDERFFMYAEEADWQRRMADVGWTVVFTPMAEVVHLGGASGACQHAQTNEFFFDSLDRYTKKHHGRLGLVSLRIAMIVGCAARCVVWVVLSMSPRLRSEALQKSRFHGRLMFRQATSFGVLAHE